MSQFKIFGQERVQNILASALEKERLAHAYLFHGPAGTGKDAMAIALVRTLNCEQQQSGGCNQCLACRRINALEQPGFRFIVPTPGRPKSMREDKYLRVVRERLLARIHNPYLQIDFSPELTTLPVIAIDQIRSLKQDVMLKLSGSQVRVFVISHAEQMNVAAANSLLKLLEEPPPQTHLILTSTAPDRLLQTIRSRCQSVQFTFLKETEIKDALQERWDMGLGRAQFLARMAGGSLDRALKLNSTDFDEKRDAALNFLSSALHEDDLQRLAAADDLLKQYDKNGIREIFQLVIYFLRDLLHLRMADAPAILNTDKTDSLRHLLQHHATLNIETAILMMAQAVDFIEKNVYLDLVVHNCIQDVAVTALQRT